MPRSKTSAQHASDTSPHFPITHSVKAEDVPILAMDKKAYGKWLKKQDSVTTAWLSARNFLAEPGMHCALPDAKGRMHQIVAIISEAPNLWDWATIASYVPATHRYYFHDDYAPAEYYDAVLGWALASYRFTLYKEDKRPLPILRVPAKQDISLALDMASAVFLARDLVNRPANDLNPATLADACHALADAYQAEYREVAGDDLLTNNYPTIHAVGRACAVAPRLAELRWGKDSHPKVTLVGKGVCFDTGGLNLKPDAGMILMKKDMGGAACALALAKLIMQRKLPVRLRVLIPAVENSVSGNSFRPQDIIRTRKGLTVEIGNTDAEGRLILSDALADADDEKPDLLVDMATLTGASRVALGPDIPSFFTADDALASAIDKSSRATHDPLWRLPLWADYGQYIKSDIADLNNAGSLPYAGAITAALFLQHFVTQTKRWLHIDMMSWNLASMPGRPKGGEAQGLRTLFDYLEKTYK